LAEDRNTLVDLLGIGKPALDLEGADFDEVEIMTALPDGVPSTVLTRRPDILSAEHQLIAANANIGAARAAFFPSISLTANGGTESGKLGGLFAAASRAWTFEPEISIPIFTGGLNEANLDTAKIQKNIYIAQYQKAIQDAFRDVANALESRAPLDEQLSAQQQEVSAAQGDYDLSQMRFTNGVDTYLSVLTAQQTLFQAQQSLISLKLTRLENLVTLYKALGGGVVDRSVTPAPDPSPSASGP
jgi:multidrug efflux system outer membrane protein